jgi:hypothetical protein
MSREIHVRGGTSMQQHEEIVQGADVRGPIICFDREWLQVVDRRDRFRRRSIFTRSASIGKQPGETRVDPIGSRSDCDW